MSELKQITRMELLEVATLTLHKAGVDVQSELGQKVMEVAKTAPRIAEYWWEPDYGCGCLIGTVRHNRGTDEYPLGNSIEMDIGLLFLLALNEVLDDDRSGQGSDVWEVVE